MCSITGPSQRHSHQTGHMNGLACPAAWRRRLACMSMCTQRPSRSTRCIVSDHKPSKETSLSESSLAIRRRSITTVDLVSSPAPCRRWVRVRACDCGAPALRVELCVYRCCSSVAFASRMEEMHGEPAYIIRNLLKHLLELRVSERLPQLVALRHHQHHVLQLACLRPCGTREQAAAGELSTGESTPCRA